MIRAAPWEVLGTSAAAGRSAARQGQWLRAYPQATAAQAATLTPRPPFNARVETVTTKPFFREPLRGRVDRIGIPQRKKTELPTAAMGQNLTPRSAHACLLPPNADIAMFAGRVAQEAKLQHGDALTLPHMLR